MATLAEVKAESLDYTLDARLAEVRLEPLDKPLA